MQAVLTVPLVPSPKVILTGVPPLNEVKVKVLPLMPPVPALRAAEKTVEVPVLPARPSAANALPVPEMLRSETVPVLIFSAPLPATDDAVEPLAVVNVAEPLVFTVVRTPEARSIAVRTSLTVPPCR